MNWFLIALINPIAHAFANHFDKYLISRFIKGGAVGTLILFSSLFAVVALPVIFIINPAVFETISVLRAIILMVNGGLLMVAVLFYLYALESSEASYVVPFFELIPIFGFILGYFVLGEVLSPYQLWAGGLIVLGGTVLSIELAEPKFKIKSKLVLLMLGSSFLYAVNAVIFKSIAVNQGFLDSLFWNMLGMVVFGITLFITVKSYRREFLDLIESNHYSTIGLNMLNEIVGLIGETALVFAVLYAPVALVMSVGGLQPMFVFILGVIITWFFPKFGKESFLFYHLAQKIIGIVIITAGVYFLVSR